MTSLGVDRNMFAYSVNILMIKTVIFVFEDREVFHRTSWF